MHWKYAKGSHASVTDIKAGTVTGNTNLFFFLYRKMLFYCLESYSLVYAVHGVISDGNAGTKVDLSYLHCLLLRVFSKSLTL